MCQRQRRGEVLNVPVVAGEEEITVSRKRLPHHPFTRRRQQRLPAGRCVKGRCLAAVLRVRSLAVFLLSSVSHTLFCLKCLRVGEVEARGSDGRECLTVYWDDYTETYIFRNSTLSKRPFKRNVLTLNHHKKKKICLNEMLETAENNVVPIPGLLGHRKIFPPMQKRKHT